MCIDTLGRPDESQLGLFYCADDLKEPQTAQFFTLRHYRDIEIKGTMFCFDQNQKGDLITSICHHVQGNQYFRYNLKTRQIFHGNRDRDECLDMDESKTEKGSVFLAQCNDTSLTQKWLWGFSNETALEHWLDFGSEIIEKREKELLREELESETKM